MARRATVELEELRNRLREAEETLAAIRNGEIDSLIVTGPSGDQVFSLKGAEQPYRIFVERMLEGAVTLTPQGMILYCNRRFADMMHSRLEKVIGSQLQSYVRTGDQPELDNLLKDPSAAKVRYVLTAADGTFIPAQLAFCRLPDSEVDAICLVVTDLTEQEQRQELAAALQTLRHTQEQLQQQNEELVRARAAAEAANEAKDRFLAALSHELRTPLTPVLMTLTALEGDSSLTELSRRDLAILRRNVELEARLIDDLLDLTGIVRGKLELRTQVVDMHAIIDQALEITRPEMSAKNIKLVETLAAENTRVNADAIRLQQVLWNLIRNAVKFTPEGGQIIVRTHNENGRLHVSISDTGIGIEPSEIARIFVPFEQGNRGITQHFGGLGLGLAISKRLTEMHGGTIVAVSEGRDRGSTFALSLPTVDQPVTESQRAPITGAKPSDRRLRILLVEDHDDTRLSMRRLLSTRHTVHDVRDIENALRAAQTEQFDLVISDLGLPDGSGLELMRQLRDQHGLKGICLSGFGMDEDIARSAEAGFYHHLTKPIDVNQLESVIESLGN
ncbi:MAG TPA: ATP-binding protein [Tepidisphaeraceae bacterium]|jgi:PAS domain S-box-containing protein|nr:ATP-binding protein [Tepidisphaeraceae bacterium]